MPKKKKRKILGFGLVKRPTREENNEYFMEILTSVTCHDATIPHARGAGPGGGGGGWQRELAAFSFVLIGRGVLRSDLFYLPSSPYHSFKQ